MKCKSEYTKLTTLVFGLAISALGWAAPICTQSPVEDYPHATPLRLMHSVRIRGGNTSGVVTDTPLIRCIIAPAEYSKHDQVIVGGTSGDLGELYVERAQTVTTMIGSADAPRPVHMYVFEFQKGAQASQMICTYKLNSRKLTLGDLYQLLDGAIDFYPALGLDPACYQTKIPEPRRDCGSN